MVWYGYIDVTPCLTLGSTKLEGDNLCSIGLTSKYLSISLIVVYYAL